MRKFALHASHSLYVGVAFGRLQTVQAGAEELAAAAAGVGGAAGMEMAEMGWGWGLGLGLDVGADVEAASGFDLARRLSADADPDPFIPSARASRRSKSDVSTTLAVAAVAPERGAAVILLFFGAGSGAGDGLVKSISIGLACGLVDEAVAGGEAEAMDIAALEAREDVLGAKWDVILPFPAPSLFLAATVFPLFTALPLALALVLILAPAAPARFAHAPLPRCAEKFESWIEDATTHGLEQRSHITRRRPSSCGGAHFRVRRSLVVGLRHWTVLRWGDDDMV